MRRIYTNVPGASLRLIFLFLVLSIISVQTVWSDSVDDFLHNEVVFVRGIELGAGGRALALGGAYRALSDDLSALYWNPAGLASVRRLELTLGISQAQAIDDAHIAGEIVSNQLSRTRLNELGMVFPVPTYRGGLVFALGYHQMQGFDVFGTFEDNSPGSNFTADELESGRLGSWSLGTGIDISPAVSVGLALRLWTGYDDYSYNETAAWNDNWATFDQSIDLSLSGFNAITGVLVRPNSWLRVGATLESPLKLKVEEEYSQIEESYIDEDSDYYDFYGSYEYKISRTFKAGLGAATLLGPVILSSDVVMNDWSQITYTEEPSFVQLTKDEANREIARHLQPTIEFHFGAEVWVPTTPVRFQVGYAWLPSPFKDDDILTDKHVFNGGFSTLLDQSLLVQTALSWTGWERSIGGWGEDLQLTNLLLTLSYRF